MAGKDELEQAPAADAAGLFRRKHAAPVAPEQGETETAKTESPAPSPSLTQGVYYPAKPYAGDSSHTAPAAPAENAEILRMFSRSAREAEEAERHALTAEPEEEALLSEGTDVTPALPQPKDSFAAVPSVRYPGGAAGFIARQFGAFRCAALEMTPRFFRASAFGAGGRFKAAEHAFADGMTRDDMRSRGPEAQAALRDILKRGGSRYVNVLLPLSAVILKTVTVPEMSQAEAEREISEDSDYWRGTLGEAGEPADFEISWRVAARDPMAGVMRLNMAAVRREEADYHFSAAEAAGATVMRAETNQSALIAAATLVEGGEGCLMLHVSPEENHVLRYHAGLASGRHVSVEDWERLALSGEDESGVRRLAARFAEETRTLAAMFEHEHQAPPTAKLMLGADLPLSPVFVASLAESLPEYEIYAFFPEEEMRARGEKRFRAVTLSEADAETLTRLCASPLSAAASLACAAGKYGGEDDEGALRGDGLNVLPARRPSAAAVRRKAGAEAAAVTLFLAALAVIPLAGGVQWTKRVMLDSRLHEAEKASLGYETLLEEAKTLKAAADRLNALKALPQELPLNQRALLAAVRDVHAVIPDHVWLTKFEYNFPAEIVLSGEADFDSDVVAFQERLASRNTFESASLNMMQAREAKAEAPAGGEPLPEGEGKPPARMVKSFVLRGMLPGGAAFAEAVVKEKAAKKAAKSKTKGKAKSKGKAGAEGKEKAEQKAKE